MGAGIDAARAGAPLHAAVLDDFKDQLIIALLRRLGPRVDLPVAEVDATGGFVVTFAVRGAPGKQVFHFEVQKKQ